MELTVGVGSQSSTGDWIGPGNAVGVENAVQVQAVVPSVVASVVRASIGSNATRPHATTTRPTQRTP